MTDWLASCLSDPAFERVRTSCDLERLAQSRVVLAGTGGASAAALDLARMGVGEFVLIDFDRVEPSNVGTQAWLRADIGACKVDALARHIHAVNPHAAVLPLAWPVEDVATTFGNLLRAPMAALTGGSSPRTSAPRAILLCGMTDSVSAQALVNRLALRHSAPSLCVQIYREGRAFELTFTYPGLTAACHRCILRRRFEAHEAGQPCGIASAGNPLSTTASANALTEHVALALLHGQDGHPRWSALLGSIATRNLALTRLDPDVAQSLGLRVFDRALAGAHAASLCMGETIWLEQPADPACADCGDATLRRPAAAAAGAI